jgi:hypothetical protein
MMEVQKTLLMRSMRMNQIPDLCETRVIAALCVQSLLRCGNYLIYPTDQQSARRDLVPG